MRIFVQEIKIVFQRTAVISFGIFGIASAISLLIFVGKLSDSMVVREIRQLVKNPEYKDPYGLDLDDILDTINILFALGIVILLASIFGILGMFVFGTASESTLYFSLSKYCQK